MRYSSLKPVGISEVDELIRSVRVTIAPEGAKQIVIDWDQIASDVLAAEGETMTYRFYCPFHRAYDERDGRIVVAQQPSEGAAIRLTLPVLPRTLTVC